MIPTQDKNIWINSIFCLDSLLYLRQLPDNSIHCILCSPPYYRLRQYLDTNDSNSEFELGQENTPVEYITRLIEIFQEAKRVLRDDGTLWVNLDDTYSANRGYQVPDSKHKAVGNDFHTSAKEIGIPSKSLMGIPWRFAIQMIDNGWILRSDIIWNKDNSMPEPVEDRVVRSHEYVFQFAKSQDYWFDHNIIKEAYFAPMDRWGGTELVANGQSNWDENTGQKSFRTRSLRPDPNGRNRRSVWSIPTEPSGLPHFAAWPKKLVDLIILAGCPPDGIVCDPFMGIGTSARAALRHGRRYTGCDLNSKYVQIAIGQLQIPDTVNMFADFGVDEEALRDKNEINFRVEQMQKSLHEWDGTPLETAAQGLLNHLQVLWVRWTTSIDEHEQARMQLIAFLDACWQIYLQNS